MWTKDSTSGVGQNQNPPFGRPFFFADPAPLPLLVTVAVLVDELDEVRVVVRGGGERETEGTCRDAGAGCAAIRTECRNRDAHGVACRKIRKLN